jgi:hypothetical protein
MNESLRASSKSGVRSSMAAPHPRRGRMGHPTRADDRETTLVMVQQVDMPVEEAIFDPSFTDLRQIKSGSGEVEAKLYRIRQCEIPACE